MKHWQAKWIGFPGICLADWRRPTVPAPEFRRTFTLEHDVAQAEIFIAGLGYFEFRLDGELICGDRLTPAPTQYDRRWRYKRYVLSRPLPAGPHLLSVTLGNGQYNSQTPEVWHFDKADWRAYPKMICQLEEKGNVLLCSDSAWLAGTGPLLFDSLRGGEIYDARLESQTVDWKPAAVVAGPGGIGEEEIFPPCRAVAGLPLTKLIDRKLYAAPYNLTGVVALQVRGEAGARVVLRHGERLSADGKTLDNREIAGYILDDTFQRDEYILKGEDLECWSPRFTFHGFQFVEVECSGEIAELSLEALVIHTDFPRHGDFETTDSGLTTLAKMAERSCESNFVGIPMDCPHREKNGWTSEAQLMQESFLYTRDSAAGFAAFADLMADAQRPNGQLPGMVPSPGWGYNWGNGPVYDSALFFIPYTTWLFTGDAECIQRNYVFMTRYLSYCESVMESDGIFRLGLSDWLPPQKYEDFPAGFVQTAYWINCLDLAAKCARLIGKAEEAAAWTAAAEKARIRFNANYYLGSGRYRGTGSVIPALALQFRLVPENDRPRTADWLKEILTARNARVDYGTVGSRQVPRALFENGMADLAFRLMTQPEYPGYAYWYKTLNLTTFPECWDAGAGSRNHGAFADILACMYRYLGGFRHSESHPGPRFLELRPQLPAGLPDFSARYRNFESRWQRRGGEVEFEFAVPEGAEAEAHLPGGEILRLAPGRHRYNSRPVALST